MIKAKDKFNSRVLGNFYVHLKRKTKNTTYCFFSLASKSISNGTAKWIAKNKKSNILVFLCLFFMLQGESQTKC